MIKKNKVIIFYPSFESGGVEKNLINLSKFLLKKGFNLDIITNEKFLNKKKNKLLNFYIVNRSKFLFFLPYRWNIGFSSIKKLIKVLKESNKNKTIIHSMQSSMISIIICKLFGFKIVARNSEDPISSTFYSTNKIQAYLVFIMRFFIYNWADGIITNSKGSANSLKKFMIRNDKVCYVYNPYLTSEKISEGKRFYNKTNTIVSVGRLTKQKNFELLILAFYDFSQIKKNYKLIIIGRGNKKKSLIRLIHKLKLTKKVQLKGFIKKPNKFIRSAKLFVLPSLYEGLGNVLIDAINLNTPCIATNCKSGPAEILLNGRGGYLIENNNRNKLSEKMIYALNNYKESVKKNSLAKKKNYRFLSENNSKIYLDYLLNFSND